MMNRDTQIVAGVAAFIIVIGVVAAAVVVFSQEPQLLDENLWFRITSDKYENTTIPLNSTLSLITISAVDGDFGESMLYTTDGEWQSSVDVYEIGNVMRFVIFFFDTTEYYEATYRIGRGPVSVDIGTFMVEFVSYWETPDY